MPLCTFDQTHHLQRPSPPRSTLKTTANQQQTRGEQPIILLLRFLFPRLSSVRSSPCATPRTPFISSPGTTSARANRMPICKAGCVFGCWQLTGCRGTLLSLSESPPAESAEIPEAPPPSVDGVTEPLGPLEASSGEHSASFSLLHKPATLLHCFPFIGTPSLFDFFSSTGCACSFVCKPRRVRSKMSISKPSKPSSCFNSSEPCTADGMVARSSAVSKAWRGVLQEMLTAARQPASSIMLSSLNRQWVQGSSKRLVKESGVDVHHSIQIPTLWTCGCAHRGHE